jgi:hypothetical protein
MGWHLASAAGTTNGPPQLTATRGEVSSVAQQRRAKVRKRCTDGVKNDMGFIGVLAVICSVRMQTGVDVV